MSDIWVFSTYRNSTFNKVSYEMIASSRKLATSLGGSTASIVFDSIVHEADLVPLAYYGADDVLILEDPSLSPYTTDAYANALTALAEKYKPLAIFFANDAVGLDMAPVVAQNIGAPLLTDVMDMTVEGTKLLLSREAYSGKIVQEFALDPGRHPLIATIRAGALEAAQCDETRPVHVTRTQIEDFGTIRQVVKDVVRKTSARVDLTEARCVVGGGRGIRGEAGVKLIEDLADVLGAAVGGSRAAIDEGWIEGQYQIGQTGKSIAPDLYIACGISGTIQHMSGASAAKCIVAINKDEEADIFKVADYGIVADLFTAIPLLIEELRLQN
ncbi:electron transfer flavoprotein subunit alpha [Gordonibacter sp. 28C]|uniref:electron transfer flavoprotein subunit alpha/FixB family protein n=1 Tax=Gordonibacter sp. 28C TaxID=2078569 RepID=UPI000DF7A77F|nr:electron transfer flavoprotein subunit alpha/FixB family protein [Gordonibacter sp. 28C]RDB64439.1 electron transfer flavoprotein subunit alpha [Gordonibacter sp. 28C]